LVVGFHLSEITREAEILGRVADFCSICRGIRPFTIRRLEWVEMEMYLIVIVPVTHSRTVGPLEHDRVCESCGFRCAAFPGDYREILRDGSFGPQALETRTHPELRSRYSDRLDLADRIRRAAIDESERPALIEEPFRLLDPEIRRLAGPGPGFFWRWGPFALLGGGIGLAALSDKGEIVGGLAITAALLMWLILGFRHLLGKVRMRASVAAGIYPLLGRALAPLHPSPSELAQALERISRESMGIAKWVTSDRVQAEIEVVARDSRA
jgi:hypothetical protein